MARVFHYYGQSPSAEIGAEAVAVLHRALPQAGYGSFLLNAAEIGGVSFAPDDVLLLHDVPDRARTDELLAAPCRKVLVKYNRPGEPLEGEGQQLAKLAASVQLAVASADQARRELVAFGFRNTETVPLLYDDRLFRSPQLDFSLYLELREAEAVNLVCTCDWRPERNIECVIDAAAEYIRLFRGPVRLHLIGNLVDQDYAAALMRHAAEKRVLGAVERHVALAPLRLKTLLAGADALVSCDASGDFDTSVVKAFTVGCPVIARRASSVSPTSGAGFVIAEPEPAVIAGLVELLRRDGQIRTALLRQQFSAATEFRTDRTIHRWMDVLRRQFDLRPVQA